MLFFATLISALLSLPHLALTAPAPRVHSVSSNSTGHITYYVTNFIAFVATQPDIPSRVTFDFSDRREQFNFTGRCELEAQSIYSKDFTKCAEDLYFKLTQGQLILQRGWVTEFDEYIDTEAPQPTYWNSTQGGNVTVTNNGTYYLRTSEWEFPVLSMWM